MYKLWSILETGRMIRSRKGPLGKSYCCTIPPVGTSNISHLSGTILLFYFRFGRFFFFFLSEVIRGKATKENKKEESTSWPTKTKLFEAIAQLESMSSATNKTSNREANKKLPNHELTYNKTNQATTLGQWSSDLLMNKCSHGIKLRLRHVPVPVKFTKSSKLVRTHNLLTR